MEGKNDGRKTLDFATKFNMKNVRQNDDVTDLSLT